MTICRVYSSGGHYSPCATIICHMQCHRVCTIQRINGRSLSAFCPFSRIKPASVAFVRYKLYLLRHFILAYFSVNTDATVCNVCRHGRIYFFVPLTDENEPIFRRCEAIANCDVWNNILCFILYIQLKNNISYIIYTPWKWTTITIIYT